MTGSGVDTGVSVNVPMLWEFVPAAKSLTTCGPRPRRPAARGARRPPSPPRGPASEAAFLGDRPVPLTQPFRTLHPGKDRGGSGGQNNNNSKLIQHVRGVSHCSRRLVYNNAFRFHTSLILGLLWRRGNRRSERLSGVPGVTQLGRAGAKVQRQGCGLGLESLL